MPMFLQSMNIVKLWGLDLKDFKRFYKGVEGNIDWVAYAVSIK